MYNLTNITGGNETSLLSFTQDVSTNILGGYYIGWIIMIMAFCVFFFAMKSKGNYTSASFAVGCWMTTLCTVLLRPMGLIDDYTWWVGIILTPIALFVLFMASSD